MRLVLCLLISFGCLVNISCAMDGSVSARTDDFRVFVKVDFGADIGQNFGTLFEAVDERGKVVAGAGFLGSYNTQARSDRHQVHFYVKTDDVGEFKLDPISRVNDDFTGTYIYESGGKLFARGRCGGNLDLYVWDQASDHWSVDRQTVPFSIQVGRGTLAVAPKRITYDDRCILELGSDEGSIVAWYYANGFIVFRRHDQSANPPLNELRACKWTPNRAGQIDLSDGHAIALRMPREFVYAYGQLGDQAVAATNMGGFYAFDGKFWRCVLEPDAKVSFQIYTIMNYRDRLLMGQYPTGELFEYDGQTLRHLDNWPPVMEGVLDKAREAQTLTIYGGDIYVGVWPWGEVWRRSEIDGQWQFMGRTFTHPQPTTQTVHPYERETKALEAIWNRWGQRVTGLVPIGDSLYIATSSKGGNAYEPKFTFLADGQWKEYGALYRYRRPGQLCAPIEWKDAPTTLEFVCSAGRMSILQDGQPIGSSELKIQPDKARKVQKVIWAKGIFGPLRGNLLNKKW